MKDDDKQKIFDTLRAMNDRQAMVGRMQEYSHSCVLLAVERGLTPKEALVAAIKAAAAIGHVCEIPLRELVAVTVSIYEETYENRPKKSMQ